MKNKIIILILLLVFSLFFVLCDIVPQITYPTDSLPEDFESYDDGATPGDPWMTTVVSTDDANKTEPRVEYDSSVDNNFFLIMEDVLDDAFGTDQTGFSAAQLKFGVEAAGTLEFRVVFHNGWDTAGDPVDPNCNAEFWLNLATADLEDPGSTPDWTNGVGDTQIEDQTVSIVIDSPGDYLLTWKVSKPDTGYDEDTFYIDDITFTEDASE
jgi:hypothetical protein